MFTYHSKWCNYPHQHNFVLVPRPCTEGKVTFPPPMWPVYEATLSFGVWGPRKWRRGRRREKEWLYIVILKLHARFHGFSVRNRVLCWQWGCGYSFIFMCHLVHRF